MITETFRRIDFVDNRYRHLLGMSWTENDVEEPHTLTVPPTNIGSHWHQTQGATVQWHVFNAAEKFGVLDFSANRVLVDFVVHLKGATGLTTISGTWPHFGGDEPPGRDIRPVPVPIPIPPEPPKPEPQPPPSDGNARARNLLRRHRDETDALIRQLEG